MDILQCLMYIQNRNSVDRIGNQSQFELYWKKHPHLKDTYVHRISNKQLQSHLLIIPYHQLPKEISFIQGRINNKHPNLCCVYYYEEQHAPPHQELHRLKVYTDRILPLQIKDWTLNTIGSALQGFKRLLMTYGPMKITEGLFFKNETGEIKVWISQNPVKNRPDFPIVTEHQTVATLVQLLYLKNPFLSHQLSGCMTIRQCIARIERNKKKHRMSPSIGMYMPQEKMRPGSVYPFHRPDYIKTSFPSFQSDEARNKSHSEHVFVPLWKSNENWFSKQKKINPVNKKQRNTSFFSFTQGPFFEHQQPTRHSGPSYSPNIHSQSYHPSQNSFKYFPTTPPSRFGTRQFTPNKPSHHSHRGQKTYRFPHHNSLPKKSVDITIINNNVSNYIGHFPKGPYHEDHSQRNYVRQVKTPYFNWKVDHRGNSPPSKIQRNKGVPSFIKKKGLQSNDISMQNSNQTTQVLINHNSKESAHSYKRKEAKIFTFFSKEKQSQAESQPITPKAENVSQNLSVQIQRVGRAQSSFFPSKKRKNTEEQSLIVSNNNPPPKLEREEPMSSSSLSSGPTSAHVIDDFKKEDQNPMEESKKSVNSSLELRRMLKKEYQDLLGLSFEPIEEEAMSVAKFESHRDSEEKKRSTIKQSELKEKIKQKQQAFAELKKEALKVLTDF